MNGEKIDGKIEIFRRSNKIDCTNCCGWQQFNHNWMLHLICASLVHHAPCSQCLRHQVHYSSWFEREWEQCNESRELCSGLRKHTGNLNVAKTNFHTLFSLLRNCFVVSYFWVECCRQFSGHLFIIRPPHSATPGEEHFVKWRQSDLYAFISHTNFGTHKRSKQQKKT